jgi:hypothetical protein
MNGGQSFCIPVTLCLQEKKPIATLKNSSSISNGTDCKNNKWIIKGIQAVRIEFFCLGQN